MVGVVGARALLKRQKCEGDEATRRHAAPSQEKKKKQNQLKSFWEKNLPTARFCYFSSIEGKTSEQKGQKSKHVGRFPAQHFIFH